MAREHTGQVVADEGADECERLFRGGLILISNRPLADMPELRALATRIEVHRLDVTDAESIRMAVASILTRTGGRLDAIVHNAGVAVAAAFEDVPLADLRRVMDTNFFGVLELA